MHYAQAILEAQLLILRETANIKEGLRDLERKIEHMSPKLQALKDELTANKSVADSLVKLVKGLADQLQANKDDPAAIDQMVADLHAETDAIAAAVTANTPAAPPADGGTPA